MKAFFVILTDFGNWGKALTIQEALEKAKVNKLTKKYIICIGIVDEKATDDELKNIANCFNVNGDGSISMYYKPSAEDQKMVNELFLGWNNQQIENKQKTKS
jgi:hypothetical protein